MDGSAIQEYTAFDSFKTCASGWYYDSERHLIYVRLGSSSASTPVEISGVKSAPYEAEFAERTDVTVNTNHTGFEGTGFVDGFAEAGDSVEFDVWVPTAGSYTLGIRYSAGTEAASRDVRINGAETTLQVQMPKTQDWDSWNISTATVTLSAGANTVKIEYGSGSSAGINLDNIRIYS